MIRVLFVIAIVGLIALGLGWVADQQGDIVVNFRGREYSTSPLIAVVCILALALMLALAFVAIGSLLRLPRRLRHAAHARKQQKGLSALSQGLVAAGAGDIRSAQRASVTAAKHLGEQPMTLLLEAQTALLAGNRDATEMTFSRMARHPETRMLGLRGLHAEARQRGDAEAAHSYATEAHRIASLPWAGEAVLDHHVAQQDWAHALEIIDANLAQKTIDKSVAKRQRAVLQTAMAREMVDKDPDGAMRLASQAVSLAPDLVPATAMMGRLLGRRGDIRKASRVIEGAWRLGPHPDLADVYLDLRPGDSSADRLNRARALAKLAPDNPESRLMVARAAIAARDFAAAREAMASLIAATSDARPSARVCLLMADLEDAENGSSGMVREWLARAARAPRDKAWVADGIVSDSWEPYAPISGKLDAWKWETPPERLSNAWDPGASPAPELPTPASERTNPEITLPEKRIAPSQPAAPPREARQPFPLTTAPDDPGPARG